MDSDREHERYARLGERVSNGENQGAVQINVEHGAIRLPRAG